MRKILLCVVAALLALWAPLGALAEGGTGPQLSQMTLSELYELRDAVSARIAELESAGAQLSYESGTYRVGVDMPEGVYLIKDDGVALFPSVLVRAAGDGHDGEALSYDLVLSTAVMRFVSGSFVTLSDVTAHPFERAGEAGVELPAPDVLPEGGYWVGEQIPAGLYRVVPDEGAPLSSYSIYDDVPGDGAQLLKFEVVKQMVELDLADGQYISLSGCAAANAAVPRG